MTTKKTKKTKPQFVLAQKRWDDEGYTLEPRWLYWISERAVGNDPFDKDHPARVFASEAEARAVDPYGNFEIVEISKIPLPLPNLLTPAVRLEQAKEAQAQAYHSVKQNEDDQQSEIDGEDFPAHTSDSFLPLSELAEAAKQENAAADAVGKYFIQHPQKAAYFVRIYRAKAEAMETSARVIEAELILAWRRELCNKAKATKDEKGSNYNAVYCPSLAGFAEAETLIEAARRFNKAAQKSAAASCIANARRDNANAEKAIADALSIIGGGTLEDHPGLCK